MIAVKPAFFGIGQAVSLFPCSPLLPLSPLSPVSLPSPDAAEGLSPANCQQAGDQCGVLPGLRRWRPSLRTGTAGGAVAIDIALAGAFVTLAMPKIPANLMSQG